MKVGIVPSEPFLVSDAVNLVAAVVLYILAVGGVQGFAFTLGVTTVVDLIVIFLFTHPMMELLIRTEFFGGGHKLSGLDPEHLGARSAVTYAGRGAWLFRVLVLPAVLPRPMLKASRSLWQNVSVQHVWPNRRVKKPRTTLLPSRQEKNNDELCPVG